MSIASDNRIADLEAFRDRFSVWMMKLDAELVALREILEELATTQAEVRHGKPR